MCVATPIELDDVYYVLEEVKCGTEGTFPLGFGKILKASLRRSRRRLKQSRKYSIINGLPRPHNVIKDVPISEWRVPSAPRNDSFCAKYTLKNLSTYRLNVLKTDNTPTLSRICKFAFSSLTNSTLSQRERVKCAFTLAEVFSPCRKVKLNFGFTLAEVLITLGIIGVVAAMTLPSLIQDKQNRELQTGLKKAYSTISQALMLYQAENGEPLKPSQLKIYELKPILMKYIKNVKDCGYGALPFVAKACIPANKNFYKNFNGKNDIYINRFDDGQFIMNDSMFVMIENGDTEMLFISVDVNGVHKKPNYLGQDLFMFQIDNEGRFLPMGAKGTFYYSIRDDYCSNSNSTMNGAGCTVKALSDKDFFKNMPR